MVQSLSVYHERLHHLRTYMQEQGMQATVISSLPHIRYCTKFSGSNALLLVLPHTLHFFTDARYTVQVHEELAPLDAMVIHITRMPWEIICAERILAECSVLGFQAQSMSVASQTNIKKMVRAGGVRCTWRPLGTRMERICQAKSDEEISCIRTAAQIADAVYADILAWIQPGMSEQRVATEIAYRTRLRGSEADAFDIIVASGVRGALPHGRASQKIIERGDLVTLDFGCRVEGFHSDMTRTFAMGAPSAELHMAYEIVRQAQYAAVEQSKSALRRGMTGKDIDDTARKIITEAGYGAYFEHSTGHGLGLEVHEAPAIAQKSSKEPLVERSIITIEPGIYLPERGGVRIEDDVVLYKNDSEVLTHSPKELIIV